MTRQRLNRRAGLAAAALLVATGLLLGTLAVAAQSTAPPAQKVIQGTKERLQPKPAAGADAPAAASQAAPVTPAKRRDPFRSLLMRPEDVAGQALPPGKRGLVIAQVQVNGVVMTPTEMIAVVSMAGRNRAYFLREGDELYNGVVGKISEDGVVFKEKTVDAFGKEYEREVIKQLTSGPGAGARTGGGARPAPRPSSGGSRPPGSGA